MMEDIEEALTLVAEAFERLGIPYCVGGSVASGTYGNRRETYDIDLVADVRREHVQPLVDLLQADYYIDAQMIQNAISRQLSFNIIHHGTGMKVDVFLVKNTPFMQSQMQRIRQAQIMPGSRLYFIASLEDTILAKLDWYRIGGGVSTRQWSDILTMLRARRDTLDLAYLRQTAPLLTVSDLLDRALAEVGM